MVFPIGPELDKTLVEVNRNLVKNGSVKNMELNGNISQLSIERIHLIRDAFRVMVKANGELSILVKKIN